MDKTQSRLNGISIVDTTFSRPIEMSITDKTLSRLIGMSITDKTLSKLIGMSITDKNLSRLTGMGTTMDGQDPTKTHSMGINNGQRPQLHSRYNIDSDDPSPTTSNTVMV